MKERNINKKRQKLQIRMLMTSKVNGFFVCVLLILFVDVD